MWAPSTSASDIKMIRPYRASSSWKDLPDPAPITWMIEAHSELSSICESDAFWTLRIFPRIGRMAWNSEFRAAFVVPRADSPSTMKSSVRATSSERQSESFAGSEELSNAFLRRCNSLCARALMRVREAFATFSRTARAVALSTRLLEVKNRFSSSETTCETIFTTAGVPRTSLV